MSENKYVARLVKGRSYSVKGKVYLPEIEYEVTDEAEFNLIVRSGQFELSKGDANKPVRFEGGTAPVESSDEPAETDSEASSRPSHKKKRR